MSLVKGTQVQFEARGGQIMTGKFSHMTKSGLAYIHGSDNRPYERRPEKVIIIGEAATNFSYDEGTGGTFGGRHIEATLANSHPLPKFDINERFGFLESLVRMTIKGTRVSLVITGEGGLGKTYTVKQQLKNSGLFSDNQNPDVSDYKFVKGFATAKGLYNLLYQWNGKLIIFDDCDEALVNEVSKNIMKGALDSYDERIVSWVTNKEGGEIPNEFEFTGRIIFISNLSRTKIDQAILSRSSTVDLTMSSSDKIERMSNILHAPHFAPTVSKEIKDAAFEVVMANADKCRELTMRTLMEVIDYAIDGFQEGTDSWKKLAEYAMCG